MPSDCERVQDLAYFVKLLLWVFSAKTKRMFFLKKKYDIHHEIRFLAEILGMTRILTYQI